MINFTEEINGFYNNSIYYGDTDSKYIERKYWKVLDKAGLVGKNLRQCKKNDLGRVFIFYGIFLDPKVKHVLTNDGDGIFQQQMTFKGFNDSKRLFNRSQYFKMLEAKKILAMLPRSWKKHSITLFLYL